MQFAVSGSGPNLKYVPPTPSSTVWLFSQPYLSQINKTYRNIITTNCFPPGALKDICVQVRTPKLSPFKGFTNRSTTGDCVWAFKKIDCNGNATNCYNSDIPYMETDDVPILFRYLSTHNYTIDTEVTKIMHMSNVRVNNDNSNQLICVARTLS
jgi:hypothetical protein